MLQQHIVWLTSLALMAFVASGFVFVVLNSGMREDDYAPLVKHAYRLRTRLFWGLVMVFGPAMIYTLADLPYDVSRAENEAGPVQIVEAVGYQWRWELSHDHVAKDRPVEFRVTSADVNHGFGIYNADMRLIAQTQAMPGYTNIIRHTFRDEGAYKILCLEYCGLAHHNMVAEIQVGDL